jgi:[ribosomal protein S18]-alanine N-acetyltransferase
MAALPSPPTFDPVFAMRTLARDDLPQVAAIEQSVYEFPWTLGNFRDSFDAGYSLLGVFRQDNELVAYAVVMRAVDEAHLLNLAVAHSLQRRGIGQQLLLAVIDLVRGYGAQMLYLEVRPSNGPARDLYFRNGFRQIAIRPRYYPARDGREDALFLGLRLTY